MAGKDPAGQDMLQAEIKVCIEICCYRKQGSNFSIFLYNSRGSVLSDATESTMLV